VQPALDQGVELRPQGRRQLGGGDPTHGDALVLGAAQLLAQAGGGGDGGGPAGRVPHRLLADLHGAQLGAVDQARLGGEEGAALAGGAGGGGEALRHLAEALERADGRAGGHPGATGGDVGDAGVVAGRVEPVAKAGLEALERRGVPAVTLEQRQHALAGVIGRDQRG